VCLKAGRDEGREGVGELELRIRAIPSVAESPHLCSAQLTTPIPHPAHAHTDCNRHRQRRVPLTPVTLIVAGGHSALGAKQMVAHLRQRQRPSTRLRSRPRLQLPPFLLAVVADRNGSRDCEGPGRSTRARPFRSISTRMDRTEAGRVLQAVLTGRATGRSFDSCDPEF
jgi:hypothetical protein